MCKRDINQLPLTQPSWGPGPKPRHTLLTGNRTGDLSVLRLALNQSTEHTSQARHSNQRWPRCRPAWGHQELHLVNTGQDNGGLELLGRDLGSSPQDALRWALSSPSHSSRCRKGGPASLGQSPKVVQEPPALYLQH